MDQAHSVASGVATNNKKLKLLIAVVMITLLGFATYSVIFAHQENTDDAQVEADVVRLAVRTGGQVMQVLVKENQLVKAGDVLLELDEAQEAAKLAQAQAELALSKAQAAAAVAQLQVVAASAKGGFKSAQAQLSGSSVGVSSAIAQIGAAQAAQVRAKAEFHKADIDLNRSKKLRQAGAITQEKLDNSQAAFEETQAALLQTEAQLHAAQEAKHVAESRVEEAQGRLGQSTPIEAQINAAQAAVALAEAAVQSAQARLTQQQLIFSYLKLQAPTDGIVSKLTAHTGQLLQVGQVVAELVPSATYVVANFKETQIRAIKPHQPVKIRVDTYGSRMFHGKVESLSGGTGSRFSLLPPDNASGNFVKVVQRVPVRIAWEHLPDDVVMRAGLSVDVTVDVGEP